MAEKQSRRRRIKGILKHTPGFQSPESSRPPDASTSSKSGSGVSKRAAHYDEMNIIATLHPADKEYGKMKVTEPDTPFNYNYDGEDKTIDPDEVLKKLGELAQKNNTAEANTSAAANATPGESEETLTDEEKAKRKQFEEKRKLHYNEYLAITEMKKKGHDKE